MGSPVKGTFFAFRSFELLLLLMRNKTKVCSHYITEVTLIDDLLFGCRGAQVLLGRDASPWAFLGIGCADGCISLQFSFTWSVPVSYPPKGFS